MEEAAAMRAETKKFRLTESQLRQIIRQELNEVRGGEGLNPSVDDGEVEFLGCEFTLTPPKFDSMQGADVPGDLSLRIGDNRMDSILETLGCDLSDLEAGLSLKLGMLSAEDLMNLGADDSDIARYSGCVSGLADFCPGATVNGMSL
jgi:hypothetical protein